MFTKTEQVWRHLVDGAHHGRRRWPSVSGLADEIGIPVSTVHQALNEPRSIGAVETLGAGGARVLDPGRLLVLWAARRRLDRDVDRRFLVPCGAARVEASITNPDAVLGGCGAVVARLGANSVAAYSQVLVYGEPGLPDLADEGEACEVIVARPDGLLARYGRTTTLGQAWVDLFRLPGWQAARFVYDLVPDLLAEVPCVLLPGDSVQG